MGKSKHSENVPKGMSNTFDEIAALTDEFSQAYLNDEYGQVIRYAIAALCRKRPSPLAKGQARTWACGIIHAVGMVNFLHDKSQDPHLPASEIYQIFGVSASTGQAKSKLVRDTLKMSQLDAHWMLPSRVEKSPIAWMISYNGYILDARSLPRDIQEVAYEKGLIPYVPGVPGAPERPPIEKDISQSSLRTRQKQLQQKTGSLTAVYTLKVFIIDGPIQDDFIEKNPEIVRTIQVLGKHTLAVLHAIIFKAFDREEEHLYEFQIGGKGPNDPNAQSYGLQSGNEEEEDARKTAIASLDLSVNDCFGYWFDFGDDWWHQVTVIAIEENAGRGKYPKITERIGASPPQYAEFD